MTDPKSVLEAAQTILLVDWPHTGVPCSLLEAGFTVFGYSPHGFSQAEVVFDRPDDVDASSVFPAGHEGETGYLIFRRLDSRPAAVNIVCVYRPAAELPGILAEQALPLGAKAVWLQRPVTSAEERALVEDRGLIFVEDCDIAAMARALSRGQPR